MGARIDAAGDRPPIAVTGGDLHGIDYALPVASAQVKSAVLLARLRALGAEAEEAPDGFAVRGRRRLAGGTADAAGDRRLAMAQARISRSTEALEAVLAAAGEAGFSWDTASRYRRAPCACPRQPIGRRCEL